MVIGVYNYNSLERLHSIEAHSDYIRHLAVHNSQSLLLSASDDMTIKLWDWDARWDCVAVFEGHAHYVMQVGTLERRGWKPSRIIPHAEFLPRLPWKELCMWDDSRSMLEGTLHVGRNSACGMKSSIVPSS